MVNCNLTESVNILIDELARLLPEVLNASNKDRKYPVLVRKNILGLVDGFIDAEKEALTDLKYKREFGDDVLSAVLPLTATIKANSAVF